MAIFVFTLSLILAIAGFGGLFASVDLMPTEIGLLYAGSGVILISASFIVASIGALILRLGALASAVEDEVDAHESVIEPPPAFLAEEPAPTTAPPEAASEPSPPEDEDDVLNENRTGHLPTLQEMEEAIARPEPAPTLVGRYTAGGASYMIFSDGTIEAETSQGAYRFASMGDFKAFLSKNKEA
jgi:hypothetical protein